MRRLRAVWRADEWRKGARRTREEVAEELSFHLTSASEDLRREGFTAREARRRAVERFGDPEQLAGRCLRARRHPVLRLALAAIPALAIGAAIVLVTATTATLDVSVFRPAIREGGEGLFLVWSRYEPSGTLQPVSRADFRDWRRATAGPRGPFEELALYAQRPGNLRLEEEPARSVRVLMGSEGLLRTLGLETRDGPVRRGSGNDAAVVLTDRLWRSLFGERSGDPSPRSVILDGVRYPAVAALEPGARLPFAADLLVPLPEASETRLGRFRGWRSFYAVGRLAPGIASNEAEAAVRAEAERLGREHPLTNRYFGAALRPYGAAVADLGRGPLSMAGTAAALLLVVLTASWRSSAGAGVAGEWTGEPELALLLAPLALLASWPAAMALAGGLLRVSVQGFAPMYESALGARLAGWYVAAWALGLAALAVPALRSRSGWPSRSRAPGVKARAGLLRVVRPAVACLATTALVLAALHAGRAFGVLRATDPGIPLQGLLQVSVDLPPDGYPRLEDRIAYFDGALRRLRALGRGVTAAAAARATALDPGRLPTYTVDVVGEPERPVGMIESVEVNRVDLEYFRTVRLRVLEGRGFDDEDVAGPPVAVVAARAAERLFPGGALGRSLRLAGLPTAYRVVGVVADVRHASLRSPPEAVVYLPLERAAAASGTLLVRYDGDRAAAVRSVREELRALDPTVAVDRIRAGEQRVRADLAGARASVILLCVAAGVGLLVLLGGLGAALQRAVRDGVTVRLLGLAVGAGVAGGAAAGMALAPRLATILGLPVTSVAAPAMLAAVAVGLPVGVLLARWRRHADAPEGGRAGGEGSHHDAAGAIVLLP